jgi:serine/threonine protein phosphatase PrpC
MCVVALNNDELQAVNLGDSGFMIIRDAQVVLRSREQQHSFNYPFQLGSSGQDRPDMCDRYAIEVRVNDIIVLGTDGLFDNLFDKAILTLVNDAVTNKTFEPTQTARLLAEEAARMSQRLFYRSPFTVKAWANGHVAIGGKVDDITCVLAIVCAQTQ